MEQTEFINMYIKTLIEEVTELTKTKMLLATKEDFSKANIDELNKKLEELEESVAKEKDDAAQVWKTALEEKDVETVSVKDELASIRRQLAGKENEAASLVEEKNTLATKVAELKTRVDELEKDLEAKKAMIERFENRKPVQETKFTVIEKPVEVEKPKKGRVKGVHTSF